MSELIAIAFPDETQATQVMEAAKHWHDDSAIELEDGVALVKDRDGHVSVKSALDPKLAKSTVGGLVLGTILGSLLLMPVAGAIFGAASGALAGSLSDISHISDFQNQVRDNMPPGSSAVLLLVKFNEHEKGLRLLEQHGGRLIQTTLPDDAEARIRAVLASNA